MLMKKKKESGLDQTLSSFNLSNMGQATVILFPSYFSCFIFRENFETFELLVNF